MGLEKTMKRLQMALCQSGQPVGIEKKTFFSVRYGRVMTKYIVTKRQDETGKNKRILETYKMAEVVKQLAEMYTGETGD